jgi:hypothetical protein
VLRQGMIVRLVRTMDALDPQPKVGRKRVWAMARIGTKTSHRRADRAASWVSR